MMKQLDFGGKLQQLFAIAGAPVEIAHWQVVSIGSLESPVEYWHHEAQMMTR